MEDFEAINCFEDYFCSCFLELTFDSVCYSTFMKFSVYYGFLVLYWAAVTSSLYILLFCFYWFLLISFYLQFSFLSVLGCCLKGDFLSNPKRLILSSDDFDRICSISSFVIPLLRSIDMPGEYRVLAFRKSCASIFIAISYLYETFFFSTIEGLIEFPYFKFYLILLPSCFISEELN